MTFLRLKIEKWSKNENLKKIRSKQIKKTENLGKKELAATARQRPPKKKQNSEDPSGSIRDITAHLIHDKNISIAPSCTGFKVPSAGNDPGWIYWSYEFLFFRPRGLRTRRPAQTGPGCQNLAFQRFEPIILCSFLWRFRKTKLESHNSKQMMVYEQITFFIKIEIFQKMCLDRISIFWFKNRFLY